MTNEEKYFNAFTETFRMAASEVKDLRYHQIPAWDSVGHMTLMAKIEESFNIMMDPDDMIDFSSFEVGKKILTSKYDVTFE